MSMVDGLTEARARTGAEPMKVLVWFVLIFSTAVLAYTGLLWGTSSREDCMDVFLAYRSETPGASTPSLLELPHWTVCSQKYR